MPDLKIDLSEDFFQEEERDGYLVSRDMKEVWAVQLELVLALLTVCEKYDLKCFADAGTLLGAVRHKGFIPWDDDIDMVMFRKDYDKLVQVAQKEFIAPCFFQTAYSDVDYITGHAQLRHSETAAILKGEWDCGRHYNKGIFIDIFVLDGVSENQRMLKKQYWLLKLLSKMLFYVATDKEKLSQRGKIVRFALDLLRIKRVPLFTKREDVLRQQSVAQSKMVAPLSFAFETKKRIRDKALYQEIVWLDFETIKLPAPAKYHEFLQQRYGDYMHPQQLPTTHGEMYLNTRKSYKEMLSEKVCLDE